MFTNSTGQFYPDQHTDLFLPTISDGRGQRSEVRTWDTSDPFVSAQLRDILKTVFTCYVRQLIIWLGIPGNVLSCLVFWKQGLSDRITLLLFWLAVADLSNLTAQVLLMPLCYLTDPAHTHTWALISNSKVAYVSLWSNTVSQTLIVGVSVDRCLSVALPLTARRLLTYRSMVAAIVLSYLVSLMFFLPSFLAFTVKWRTDSSTNQSTAYVDNTDWFPVDGRFAVDIMLYFSVFAKPVFLLVVIICCVITTVSLRRFSRTRDQMTRKAKDKDKSGDRRITHMLLFLCLVYIVLVLPETTSSIVASIFPEYFAYRKYHNTAIVVYCFVWIAACLNSSANFFAYLVLSSRFQQTLKELCFCLWTRST